LDVECECHPIASEDPISELFSAVVCQQGNSLTLRAQQGPTQATFSGTVVPSGRTGPLDDVVTFNFTAVTDVPLAEFCQSRLTYTVSSANGAVTSPGVVEGDYLVQQIVAGQCAFFACPSARVDCSGSGRFRAVITQPSVSERPIAWPQTAMRAMPLSPPSRLASVVRD
jgi:hypothetical protein